MRLISFSKCLRVSPFDLFKFLCTCFRNSGRLLPNLLQNRERGQPAEDLAGLTKKEGGEGAMRVRWRRKSRDLISPGSRWRRSDAWQVGGTSRQEDAQAERRVDWSFCASCHGRRCSKRPRVSWCKFLLLMRLICYIIPTTSPLPRCQPPHTQATPKILLLLSPLFLLLRYSFMIIKIRVKMLGVLGYVRDVDLFIKKSNNNIIASYIILSFSIGIIKQVNLLISQIKGKDIF